MQGLDLHVCFSPLLPRTHVPHRLVLMWMQSWWMAEILCTMLQTMDMQMCWSTSCQRELRLMWGWREGGEKEDKRGGGSKPICLCVLKAHMSSGQSSPTTPPQILGNVLSLWGKPEWLAAQAENFTTCVHKSPIALLVFTCTQCSHLSSLVPRLSIVDENKDTSCPAKHHTWT